MKPNPLSLVMSRRRFMKQTSLAAGLVAATGFSISRGADAGPSKRMVLGVIGLGRGLSLAQSALQLPGVDLAYVCDVDRRRLDAALKTLEKKLAKPPRGEPDFRRMLEDKRVDAVLIATCNHWHAPATILACAAGKHVYVEKPGSHNAREGELMVAAARKNRRVVQMGTQRRSFPGTLEGIERLRSGVIGEVRFARSWYTNARTSIGRGRTIPVPPALDYSLWQGPAPERPYADNLVHYNWHWRWHWGNGELGNNGIHYLDLARWGLGVDYPLRITYNGGRYRYQDDQETPDTGTATFDFGTKGASWEHSSCHPCQPETFPLVRFYGDNGVLALDEGGYKIFDLEGKLLENRSQPFGDQLHIGNFLDCIRNGKRPNADIEEGQKSTLLCHLGNIAYRTGRTLHFDPATRKLVNDSEAQALWGRDYRPGWEPKVL